VPDVDHQPRAGTRGPRARTPAHQDSAPLRRSDARGTTPDSPFTCEERNDVPSRAEPPTTGSLSDTLVAVDVDWSIQQLNEYLRLHERVPLPPSEAKANRKTRLRGSAAEREDASNIARLIGEALYEDPVRWVSVDGVRRMVWELTHGDEVRERLGLAAPDAPRIRMDSMHPWVWEAASPHWPADNHAAAVWAASVNVNSRLQQKVRRRNIGEGKLIAECFSIDPPAPGKPRLRRCDESNPDLFRDLHSGAIALGRGLYSAVRNPLSHLTDSEGHAGQVEHLEALAGFSLLARWIDAATVTRADHDDSETHPD
jgi:hypothetical protein